MEPHKILSGIDAYKPNLADGPIEYFRKALIFARDFYSEQMDQIASVKFSEVTADFFFREYIWVVHATGFSAKAVGKFMPRLTEAYGSYNSLGSSHFEDSFLRIKVVCNNPQKSTAVWQTAIRLHNSPDPWPVFREENLSSPNKLKELPYIGPVTCYHLARNIGILDCVKPDLHLIRMAKYWGFADCNSMCKAVQPEGMPLGIVDLVLWYAASTWGTIEVRQEGDR